MRHCLLYHILVIDDSSITHNWVMTSYSYQVFSRAIFAEYMHLFSVNFNKISSWIFFRANYKNNIEIDFWNTYRSRCDHLLEVVGYLWKNCWTSKITTSMTLYWTPFRSLFIVNCVEIEVATAWKVRGWSESQLLIKNKPVRRIDWLHI